MRISVFGLGYVGCVSAGCLAEAGHPVVGVDKNQLKVDLINSGRSPIIEKDIDGIIRRAVAEGRLRATTDALDAVIHSDISLLPPSSRTNLSSSHGLYMRRSGLANSP